jgi:GT2 family glycosyltransferase
MSASASVVIPVHRVGPRLQACLEALRKQHAVSPEIVITLDGRVELPPQLASLADKVVEGPGTGPAGARNRGFRAASGSLILFTDSDCVPEPGWAGALAGALEAGADGVKGVYSGGGRKLIQRLAQVEFEQRYEMLARRESVDLVDTYSAGFRREALEAVGGFDESFPAPDNEDVDLSWRLCRAGYRLVFTREARVSHEHRPSWAAYFGLKLSRGRWRMKALRKFPGKAISDSYTPLSVKAQVLLAGALLPVLAATPFLPLLGALWLLAFLASCVPLTAVALRTDAGVAPAVPLFSMVRGTALLAGTIRGLGGT